MIRDNIIVIIIITIIIILLRDFLHGLQTIKSPVTTVIALAKLRTSELQNRSPVLLGEPARWRQNEEG
jgi:hypothetical protein